MYNEFAMYAVSTFMQLQNLINELCNNIPGKAIEKQNSQDKKMMQSKDYYGKLIIVIKCSRRASLY